LTTNNNRKPRVFIFLILFSFISAHLCFLLFPGIFETWNAQAVDRFFKIRSSLHGFQPTYDTTVAHVDLNNTSIQRLKNLYLNRGHYAKLIDNLSAMGVSAQVFDFIFAAPKNQKTDEALIRATRAAGNVYFGMAFEFKQRETAQKSLGGSSDEILYIDGKKWKVSVDGDTGLLPRGENPLATYAELAAVSRGLGSLSVKFDRDGVLRRVPLLVHYQDAYYPLLPLQVVCDYLNVSPSNILLQPGKFIVLPGAKKPGEEKPRNISIPIDQNGNMVINYIGPWSRLNHYNFADILLAANDQDEMELWREELAGKILIISDVSTGSADIGPVPTDGDFPLSGAHTNIINAILTQSFLREVSGLEMLALEVLLMATLFLMAIRLSSIRFSAGSITLVFLLISGVFAAFVLGSLMFNIIRPLLMLIFATAAIIIYQYINTEKEKLESIRQKDFIRDTFGRYLSSEVVDELLDTPQGLKMSGETREVTFLVSDLRGFTALTSQLLPHEIIGVINRYFERMVAVISRYGGVVNEFLGDGILVFFGAPLKAPDDAERAVACAIEMQSAMVKVNQEQKRLELPELSIGIGINTGKAVVGNIGSEQRAKYGAVGSPINTAFRIESYTVGGQILLGPDTHAKVRSLVQVQATQKIEFKGLDHPIELYDVIGIDGPYQSRIPLNKVETTAALDSPLPFSCYPLKGKTVSTEAIAGDIIKFGENIAEAHFERPIEVHTNLRIIIKPDSTSDPFEVYAKVIPMGSTEPASTPQSVRLQFTWMPETLRIFLNNNK
jgi:adenylate cyclase